MHPLIQHFEKLLPFTLAEKEKIRRRVHQKKIKRKAFMLQEGEICRYYSFVINGCFRMYGVDDKGYQHNLQFASEGDWIMDIGSFHSQKISLLSIQALEPSEIIQIERQDLYHLYLSIPKLDRIFKVLIENKYVELQNRVLQSFSSTADQRYINFLEQYPELANRLPNTQIASYIGITPEFLSKIRRRLAKTF